jgi:hypothetical protein
MIFRTHRSAWLFAGFVLAVALAVAAWVQYRLSSPIVLDAPAPQLIADSRDPAADVVPSVIDAVVEYNLDAAVDSLEAAVPHQYGDIEQRLPLASNTRVSYGYAVSRSPFVARITGQSLAISADVEYAAHVWYRPPLGPELSAGCGTGDDPRPRVRATLLSTPTLTPEWRLRTVTRVQRLQPYSVAARDRCRLTVLRIDVTDRVIAATRQMLDDKLVRFDQTVSRWPVRARFERMWAQLQSRIKLTDGVYLEINPYDAQVGLLHASGDTVTTHLRLIAAPRVTTSEQREIQRPLPPLRTAAAVAGTGPSAHVMIEGTFSYPVASELLRRAVVGRTIVQGGRRVRIRDVQLSGIGGGRVALGVTLSGPVRGRLYFTGTPRVDAARGQISVPDLDFDIGTEQALVQGFAWLRGVNIRDFLRERARLPDSEAIGKLRGLAQHGINRRLAPGVTLSGTIHDARGTSVHATVKQIALRAVADAEFQVTIDRGPRIPRQGMRRRAPDPEQRGRGRVAER